MSLDAGQVSQEVTLAMIAAGKLSSPEAVVDMLMHTQAAVARSQNYKQEYLEMYDAAAKKAREQLESLPKKKSAASA